MIPDSQLSSWTALGAVQGSKDTYASTLNALATHMAIERSRYDTYLQGSYRNTTNIRGDSDVDVVVELTSTFRSNTSALSPEERAEVDRRYPDATYDWRQFRAHVLQALKAQYGISVVERNKCITVRASGGRLPADILVCMTHRLWQPGLVPIEGVAFLALDDGRLIVNYPKQIATNLEAKNGRTRNFKGSVRMFKNARNEAVRRSLVVEADAPSYHLQNLLYNAYDSSYSHGTWSEIYLDVLGDLKRKLDAGVALVASNEVHPLFGAGDDRWDEGPAHRVVAGLQALWDRW